MSKVIFDRSVAGGGGFSLPPCDVAEIEPNAEIESEFLRVEPPILPELSEIEVVRHYVELSQKAYGVDNGFYPLGSCTMKYNPKINEWAARLPGFAGLHPYQPGETIQGALELLYRMEGLLCEIGGMEHFTLQPAAGAHGELCGLMIIKAYHRYRQDSARKKILVPDSAHGTNPATAHVLGYEVVEVKSNENGLVDLQDLKARMSSEVAALMLTNPNTLGLFEKEIEEIAQVVHDGGGLLYYDGANLNGILGVARPGDMGFDVVHFNLHKTFATPHGGGGPGSGPVGVKGFLADFLPRPIVGKKEDGYYLDYDRPLSIGRVRSFYGNFGVILKAYSYIVAMGGAGLREACELAVLNANYLRLHLQEDYHIPFNDLCKHEFVASGQKQLAEYGVSTLDIAKRLMDYGFHPPTVYFPLIVKEALMIEPVETESRERLDGFIAAMREIAREARENPDILHQAPHNTPIGRVDEVQAARKPILRWLGL